MKGMPHLHHVSGTGQRPQWVGRTLYVSEDAGKVRRRYQREDALPPPDERPAAGSGRPSVAAFVRRLVGLTGA